jgi:hypothetical protein
MNRPAVLAALALSLFNVDTLGCKLPQWAVNSSCTPLPFDTTIAATSTKAFATVAAFSIQVTESTGPFFTITLSPQKMCNGSAALIGPHGFELDYPLDVGQTELNAWRVNQTFTNNNNLNTSTRENWTFWVETHRVDRDFSCAFEIRVEAQTKPVLLLPAEEQTVSIEHHEWSLLRWTSMLSQPFQLKLGLHANHEKANALISCKGTLSSPLALPQSCPHPPII